MDYFGARYYESSSGRWLSVDPLRDKYPGWSGYNYVEDNPERNVDPDGRDVAFHESARKSRQFNKALNLYLKTKLGSKEMNRFQNDHSILVIYEVGNMSTTSAETIAGKTQWLIGSQNYDKVSLSSDEMGIKEQTFDNNGKVVITITLDAKTLIENSTLNNAETIYHEGKAHLEYDRDKRDLTGTALSTDEEHKLYGTGGITPARKASPAYEFIQEVKKAQKKDDNK